jgi:hypothetical protein
MRPLRIVVIATVGLGMLAGTALAGGGSWIEPYRESYRPGDTVVMRGGIGPGSLGDVEDGPFYAYLRVDPNAANPHRFPNIHETDLYLGELEVEGRPGWTMEVSLTFTLPDDIPDGGYEVVYCNDPCTAGLGDFLGGWITVKTPREPAPPRPASLVAFSSIYPV